MCMALVGQQRDQHTSPAVLHAEGPITQPGRPLGGCFYRLCVDVG
jgi:hypothetical protein